MDENYLLREECDKIFDFWKLQEYFTQFHYPELTRTVKEYGKDVPFDYYCNAQTDELKNSEVSTSQSNKGNDLVDKYISLNKYLSEKKLYIL